MLIRAFAPAYYVSFSQDTHGRFHARLRHFSRKLWSRERAARRHRIIKFSRRFTEPRCCRAPRGDADRCQAESNETPRCAERSRRSVDLLRTAPGTSARRKSHFTRSREGQVTRVVYTRPVPESRRRRGRARDERKGKKKIRKNKRTSVRI